MSVYPPIRAKVTAPVMLPPNVRSLALMFVMSVAAAVEVMVPPPPGATPRELMRPTYWTVPLRSTVAPDSTLKVEPSGEIVLSPAPRMSVPPATVVSPA